MFAAWIFGSGLVGVNPIVKQTTDGVKEWRGRTRHRGWPSSFGGAAPDKGRSFFCLLSKIAENFIHF